jgi:hypothetical protein
MVALPEVQGLAKYYLPVARLFQSTTVEGKLVYGAFLADAEREAVAKWTKQLEAWAELEPGAAGSPLLRDVIDVVQRVMKLQMSVAERLREAAA